MKKLLFAILIVLAFAVDASAANYFGCAGANITADNTFCATPSGSCAGSNAVTAATALQAGNNLYANGCTIVVNDSFTAGLISTEDGDAGGAAVAGGGFTLDLATVTGKTLTTSITAGSTDALVISGAAGAGTVLTIAGGTITGSSTTNGKNGVADSHTGATSVVVINAALQGGANSNANGYYGSGASGIFTITGNAACGSASNTGVTLTTGTAGSTITGNCTGGAGGGSANGCSSAGAGGLTVIGNIINGTRGTGAVGSIRWTPTVPASGVTGHYVKFDGGGTAIYVGSNTDDATKALTTFYYIDPTDGTSDQGSASAGGGGGAWAF